MFKKVAELSKRRRLIYLIPAVPLAFLLFTWALSSAAQKSFHDSFETDDEIQKKWQIDADPTCSIGLSTLQVRDGLRSARIYAEEGTRCELVPRLQSQFADKFIREPFGESRWYRFSVLVNDAGEIQQTDDLGENTIVAQWHASPDPFVGGEPNRGPPLALRIHNGKWGITYGWDANFHSQEKYLANNWHWIGPVITDRWDDWSFHVVWSHNANGLTEVRQNGQLVFAHSGPNTYNDLRGVYLKLGLYHPVDSSEIFLDGISIANDEDTRTAIKESE